jgi:hypothetical protein
MNIILEGIRNTSDNPTSTPILPRLIDPETDAKITHTLRHFHNLRRTSYLFTWRTILYLSFGLTFGLFVYICRYMKDLREQTASSQEQQLDTYISDRCAVPLPSIPSFPSIPSIPYHHSTTATTSTTPYINPLVDIYAPIREQRTIRKGEELKQHLGIGMAYQG